jgi:hypothetical protein
MRDHRILGLLVACCLLDGCADLSARQWGQLPTLDTAGAESKDSFWFDDPVEREKALATIDHEIIEHHVLNTPRGTQVLVVEEFNQRHIGTVLSTSAESVKLLNCVTKEVVPGPNGQRQVRTSHTPFQTVPIARMSRFDATGAAAIDLPSDDSEIDTQDVCITEFTFKSGRHQPLGPRRQAANDDPQAAAQ